MMQIIKQIKTRQRKKNTLKKTANRVHKKTSKEINRNFEKKNHVYEKEQISGLQHLQSHLI